MRSYLHNYQNNIHQNNIYQKKHSLRFYMWAVVLVLLPTACSNTAAKNLSANTVSELYAGFHCGIVGDGKTGAGRAPSIEWVSDQLLLERAFTRLSRQFSTASTRAPELDFKRTRVAIIYMGQQPSAGYSLQLARNEFRTYKDVAEITLEWKKPTPGMMSAQVITNPCIVVQLPVADYRQFQVVDTSGKVRVKTTTLNR